jgi:hypothetical protein
MFKFYEQNKGIVDIKQEKIQPAYIKEKEVG